MSDPRALVLALARATAVTALAFAVPCGAQAAAPGRVASPEIGYPMNCELRNMLPDGKVLQGASKGARPGHRGLCVASHAIENVGQADCKRIMFEPK